MIDGLKKAEEAKRDRNWDAPQRWKALQDMIAWAESQATVRRNTRAACLREQARKLRQLHEGARESGGRSSG